MIHIFEKVNKTKENIYGMIELDEKDVFKGPCIITIIAGPVSKKSINGSLRQVAELVNPYIDTNYDKDRRILGLGFGEYQEKYERFTRVDPTEEELNDFVNKYFYPLISTNNNKIDVLTAMKKMRNITFLTYCNGAKVFIKIEKKLEEKMIELGYSKLEISLILSQIALAAISGEILKKRETKTLAITFGDILDTDFEKNKEIFSSNKNISNEGFIQYDTSIAYAIKDDGEHSFKKHMTENEKLSKKIKSFLHASLDNAIHNYYSENIINPITYEKIENAFNYQETKKTTRR